ncbi:LuxR C-terminal-related transcriptional regulator [Nostoc sp.]|uniref:LuxR C-terminal-related transcriptional regulator n=1 Tax=Nostoc sp. TaxID=1180 RepID=UPI002FF713A4
MIALQTLFHAIAQAKDEQTLRSHISAEMSEYFSATRSGLFFFAQISLIDSKIQKALQMALSPQHNPVARYLLEHHAPVHEALVVEPKTWKLICPRTDHWHVMAGPIVSNGELVGMVGFTRQQGMPPFDSQNLTDLSALSMHISTWVATARCLRQATPTQHLLLQTERLTAREVQIASLVAQGRTNAEISAELWITENSVKQALKRMFRKLEVSSRAHMVAKLSTVSK